MSNEIIAVWEEVKRDHDVRVAILTGAGDKAFCSGADLKKLIPHIRDASEEENRWRAFQQARLGGNTQEATKLHADHRGDQRILHRRRTRTGRVL